MFANLTNLWWKIRGSRASAASKRLYASQKARRLFLELLENRSLLSAIITVNSANDDDVRNSELTLREAILINNRTLSVASLTAAEQAQVSGTPTNADTDTINFNIPGSGVQTISPTSALPTITDPVTINGYSQPKNDGSGTLAKDNSNGTGLGINAVPLI